MHSCNAPLVQHTWNCSGATNGGCFLFDGAPLACQSVSSRGAAAICDYVTGFLRKLQASKTREGMGMALSSCGIDLVSSAEEK